MKKTFYILISLVFSVSLFAQTELVHNTGNLLCSIDDEGVVGNTKQVSYTGFQYNNTANTVFFGGLCYSINDSVMGECPSYNLDDFDVYEGLTDFYSDVTFNQISEFTMNHGDQLIYVNTFSKNNEPIVYYRLEFPNETGEDWTDFYAGMIVDFDIGAGSNYNNNMGGYDTARNLIYNYDASTTIDNPNYYGIALLNSSANSVNGYSVKNYTPTPEQIFTYFTNSDFTVDPILEDQRVFISSGPHAVLNGQSITLDFALVCGTDLNNLKSNTDVAISHEAALPVELTSFTAALNGNKVDLNWATATELNNYGFEIERSVDNTDWQKIGFAKGKGTSAQAQSYSFSDKIDALNGNNISYRLKQVDFNGEFAYSDVVNIASVATSYELTQNYPNPFNPATTISYSIVEKSNVKIEVFNSVGQRISTLVNEVKDAGKYSLNFDASNLSSGIYFYTISTPNFTATKKMTLLK